MSSAQSQVRSLFDLPEHDARFDQQYEHHIVEMLPKAGELLFITGGSGSGKSRLLRSIESHLKEKQIQLITPSDISWTDQAVIDCIDLPDIEERLELLARVGLAEAWTYLQTPQQLSDGQRWRLLLAMMLVNIRKNQGLFVIAMDEFASLLDRVTAMIVARSLRKLITRHSSHCSAIICTCHDDLIKALDPDIIVICDFGATRVQRPVRCSNV